MPSGISQDTTVKKANPVFSLMEYKDSNTPNTPYIHAILNLSYGNDFQTIKKI